MTNTNVKIPVKPSEGSYTVGSNGSGPEQSLCASDVNASKFTQDKYGFFKQVDPKPFEYDMEYKDKQGTTPEMSWLRLGWLIAHLGYQASGFNVVDVGSGNGSFVQEGKKAFTRCVSYDLCGKSITEGELYSTDWDLVVLSDVLEHFHNIDDLWKMKFRYAFISFPEMPLDLDVTEWRHYKPDEHIYMLTLEKVVKWAEVHGYNVLAKGCPEDFIRTRWDNRDVNISSVLLSRF